MLGVKAEKLQVINENQYYKYLIDVELNEKYIKIEKNINIIFVYQRKKIIEMKHVIIIKKTYEKLFFRSFFCNLTFY